MKLTLYLSSTIPIAAALALAGTGCSKSQDQAANDQNVKQDSQTIQKSASDAKDQIEQQSKAEKERVETQAKAAQARIEAQQAQVKAQATKATSQVDSQVQKIENAAGNASATIQTQSGAGYSTSPSSSASSSESDQQLTKQIESSLRVANPESATAVQVSVSSGVVTLKGDVKSAEEKRQFEQKTKSVPGVSKVDNQLSVKQQ